MKRVLTIQDISCIGKCSLTVALPIISAMSTETAVIPTAVLSTHTEFDGFTFRDLTDDIEKILAHWLDEKFEFDGIYTGYIGTRKQIKIIEKVFNALKTEDNYIIVDPVMGDGGKFYSGFDIDFVHSMRRLCKKADIIFPNLTEAYLLVNREYKAEKHTYQEIADILKELHLMGVKYPVVTGVEVQEGRSGVMAYIPEKDSFFEYYKDKLPITPYGTGDIFASCFTGAFVNGRGIEESIKIAVDYVHQCIVKTLQDKGHRWYGVNFEEALPFLLERFYGRDKP